MNCPQCEHKRTDPLLIGACASVGIEHDTDTAEMVDQYLTDYHERNHQ